MTDIHDLTRELQVKNNSKIVMYVADGLGGLPMEPSTICNAASSDMVTPTAA